ncbi:MAG: hydrogenase maturation peptidase HycI [Atribacterota bacterium]|nr:hydrogenase maturation peptidase HycI [Atribacterota bacterium]MDD4895290.1 hydrogenase maturation peptidase HycI [Atribacterota bacterium]MDD5636614.1 hydrogenase maturation peptidase HycI [Atribacterota bacterium]
MSKNCLLGIGNSLRSDDGAGSFIAQHFKHHNWMVIDGKSAPENYTSVIKNIHPELLVIIDAVEMNLIAGSIRVIPVEKIVSLQLSTHYLSLSYLIEYLTPDCHKIILIGIQPLSTEMSENLSKPVLKACYQLKNLLEKNQLKAIPIFT